MKPEIVYPDESSEYWTDERCFILELWNRGEDDDVSVARARVATGVSTKPHSVAGTTERYLITAGSATVHVEGLEPREVRSGDLVAIPPGAVQWIENTGGSDLMFYAICNPRFRRDNYRDRSAD